MTTQHILDISILREPEQCKANETDDLPIAGCWLFSIVGDHNTLFPERSEKTQNKMEIKNKLISI
jgi:hypothetical protein